MLLYASSLLRPGREPLLEPALWIQGDLLRHVGPRSDLPAAARESSILDLSGHVLSPGLVNAHCHLELTALEDIPYPGDFVAWIAAVLEAKSKLDFAAQCASLREGIRRSLQGGATTVGDHLSANAALEILLDAPLRGKAFVEVLGVVPEIAATLWQAAAGLRQEYSSSRMEIIPSPHSVHALDPEVLEKVLKQDLSVFSIHLAESEAEYAYFATHSGPLQDFIAGRGQARRRSQPSSIAELNAKGLLSGKILAVHGNYLSEAEINQLAQKQISLVHCPLSHRYFSHRRFPLESVRRHGLNLALGTDSLASAGSLSMLEVLRAMREEFPELSPEEIFYMATLGGAKALKLENQIGELVPGKKADLIAVPQGQGEEPLAALLKAEAVSWGMVEGNAVDLEWNQPSRRS